MYYVCYEEKKIYFDIKRKNVKNINLRVNHKLEVSVSANKNVPIDYIKKFVNSKAKWIDSSLNHYKKIENINQYRKRYVNGESLMYLGRQYKLKLVNSSDENLKYLKGYIHLYTKDMEDIKKKEYLINEWYRERSKVIFTECLQRMYKLVSLYNIEFPKLNI